MKTRRVVPFVSFALLLSALALSGCSSKPTAPLALAPPNPPATGAALTVPSAVVQDLARIRGIAASGDRGLRVIIAAASGGGHSAVVVPAGSVDALAAAIAGAGPNGKVVLAAGTHTEHSTVTISSRVTIVGENGAVLESGVTPSNEIPTIIRPALYVHGAEGATIWNLTMKPIGAVGGNAILLEDAPRTTVGYNSITQFQYSVLLQNAPGSTVIGNTVACNTGWLSGDPIECDGIVNINGAGVRIADNDVSGGLLNTFCSGSGGFYLGNKAHDGFVGMILCRVPYESFVLPSGEESGSDISGTSWIVQGNIATNNFYTGQMVVDGANNNLVVNNSCSGNGAYDIELLGSTCLFGFETPTCFHNTVVVGSHPGMTINDFGQNNTVIGSATITHNISAPCAAPAQAASRVLREHRGL
jgi:hypothetical protein